MDKSYMTPVWIWIMTRISWVLISLMFYFIPNNIRNYIGFGGRKIIYHSFKGLICFSMKRRQTTCVIIRELQNIVLLWRYWNKKKSIVHQNETHQLSVLLKWDSKIINIVSIGLVSKRHAFEVKHLGMLVTSMNMTYSMGKTFVAWPLH